MSQVRFQHVFAVLMALSVLTAFVLPERLAGKAQPQLQALFAPVARPAGAVGAFVMNHVAPDPVHDRRGSEEIRHENQELKAQLANMSYQLEDLRRRNAEREKLGPLRDLCTPVAVVGVDSGSRESLALAGSSFEGLRDGLPVLYAGGVVGRIERSGVGGAQVKLVTDVGFRIRANFAQFRREPDNQIEFVQLDTPTVVVEGVGGGAMVVRYLTVAQARVLSEGNWVVANDPDWPARLTGQPLGKITRIGHRRDAPQFAEIRVEPESNLTKLREVMVVTKEK